jgi:adenylyltransferase/sulfurtransferase
VGGDREYVGVRRTHVLASLCGSDTISLDPNHEDLIDLDGLRIRLEGLGQARRAAGVLVADVEGRRLTVFPDGRALIRGVRNESEARAVYAKYIGV